MPETALYVTIRFVKAVSEAEEGRVGTGLRPGDDDVCVWVDEGDSHLLQVSGSTCTPSLTAGLAAARQLANEAISFCPTTVAVVGLIAADDEGQMSAER